MDSGLLPRAAERAADAGRRARQLEAALARLRAGGALSMEDLRVAQQARDRARGRTAGAGRDARHARQSAVATYQAASTVEVAAAALLFSAGRSGRAVGHVRRAFEYQVLAAQPRAKRKSGSTHEGDHQPSASLGRQPAADHGLASTSPPGQLPDPPSIDRDDGYSWTPPLVIRDVAGLPGLRHLLRDLLQSHIAGEETVEDLVLATEEIAANGLRHGSPPVHVKVGTAPGCVVCAVTDQGAGFEWAQAADRPDGGDALAEGRFGLRLAQELSDELVTLRGDEGFTVRLLKFR